MNAALKCMLFFALASAVFAQVAIAEPEEDAIVPEATQEVAPMEFVDEEALQQMNNEAHAKASAYLEKAGVNACSKLSDATAQEVKDNVKAQQAIVDKINKGANCPKEGQAAVNAMKDKLKAAENSLKDATKKYNDALNVNVDIGTRKFNSLKEGNCATFFESTAYTNAKKKVANAKKAKEQAAGKITQAQKDLKATEVAARAARIVCQCDTYKNHQKALEAANAKVKAANTKAWTEAAHLKCVLAGKTMKSCTVPALPKVEGTSLAAGVNEMACALQGHKQCKDARMTSSKPSQMIVWKNAKYNWNGGCNMRAQVPANRKHDYFLVTDWSGGAAMTGFEHLTIGETPHFYPSLSFATYCQPNQYMYIYQKVSPTRSRDVQSGCYCGQEAKIGIILKPDGSAIYQMYKGGRWETCATSTNLPWTTQAKNEAYIVDSSIYAANLKLEMNLYVMGKNGQWTPYPTKGQK